MPTPIVSFTAHVTVITADWLNYINNFVNAGVGGGTVTNVVGISSNGFGVEVDNGATVPTITLSTTATGLLKGVTGALVTAVPGTDYLTPPAGAAILKANGGGALANATSGTDYAPGTSALLTGIVKSTTGTGAFTIATGADLPVMTATVAGAVPTPPNVTTKFLRGDGTWATVASGVGTVTTLTATNANGFTWTITNPTTTPNISLACSATGVLKSTAGVIAAATNADLPAMSATVGGAVPTPPNNTTTFLRGDGTWASASGSGGGTVTTVSGVNANGFSFSVANPASTPAITLTTSITGLLKGSAGALAAAVNSDLPAMSATVGGAVPTPPNNTTTFLRGDGTFAVPAGSSGTVTTFTATNANGFSWTITNPTTTPNATLGTSITGVLKGSAGALAAATGADLPAMTATVGGAVPTPPNNTTTFLRGDGTFAAPAGGGSLTLLATVTPTAVATIDFLTTFSATYDNYLILIDGVKPAADDAFSLRFANSGVVDSSSNYYWAALATNASSAFDSINIASTGSIQAAGTGASLVIHVMNVNDATNIKTLSVTGAAKLAATPLFKVQGAGAVYDVASAVSGFRLFWGGASNFAATGKVRVYGYSNT